VPVDPSFFETCNSHEVGQSRSLVTSLIEDGCRLADDFLPSLLAFAHLGLPNQLCDQLVANCIVPDIGYDRPVSWRIKAGQVPQSAAAATISVPNEAATRPTINPWIVAVVVTLAPFMELLDTAIANVALPHIAGGLAVSYDESTWVLTSYMVSNAVVLPLSAWLSRVFGRKRYYITCVLRLANPRRASVLSNCISGHARESYHWMS
jgi:hypothetical protein